MFPYRETAIKELLNGTIPLRKSPEIPFREASGASGEKYSTTGETSLSLATTSSKAASWKTAPGVREALAQTVTRSR